LRKWRLRHGAVANSLEEAGDRLFTFTTLAAKPMESARTTNAIDDCTKSSKTHQNSDRAAIRRHRPAMLFWALMASRTDHHAKGRWLADALTKAICSAR